MTSKLYLKLIKASVYYSLTLKTHALPNLFNTKNGAYSVPA